ncbi:hypothetical protein T484DRAFT_1948022, partial [Baffinella frigidus]
PNDASSSGSSSVPTSASHDVFLARRHAQRAPRACSLEAKLTSSFLSADRASDRQVDDDCECVLRAPDGRLLARFLLQLAICSSKREPRVAPALHDNLCSTNFQHHERRCSLRSLVRYGVWCMVYGEWCMVYGV